MPRAYAETDIQSLVFTGFATLPQATLIRLTGITPTWLAEAATQVAFGRDKRDVAIQLLLTAGGLRALGAPEAQIEQLGREFLNGSSSLPSRFRLGDPPPGQGDEPKDWSDLDHHAALIVYGTTAAEIDAQVAGLLSPGMEVAREALRLPESGRELFGFRDGISNISLRREKETDTDQVADGEILLGYPDHERITTDPGPLGRGGSFVAMRQLRQEVDTFWSFWRQAGDGDDGEAILLASKSVGRWLNGMPIRPGQSIEPACHDAALRIRSFAHDPQGHGCPFGSHIRRANPRDTLVDPANLSTDISALHRTLRRGRLFGPDAPASFYPAALRAAMPAGKEEDADAPRGLMFIGLCGNLRRQFEFVYQNWFNFPKHMSLFQEVDPLLHREGMPDTFSVPTEDFNRYLHGIGQWVYPTGGGYYLLPGRDVLARLGGQRPA